jgi:hypothetical protein
MQNDTLMSGNYRKVIGIFIKEGRVLRGFEAFAAQLCDYESLVLKLVSRNEPILLTNDIIEVDGQETTVFENEVYVNVKDATDIQGFYAVPSYTIHKRARRSTGMENEVISTIPRPVENLVFNAILAGKIAWQQVA